MHEVENIIAIVLIITVITTAALRLYHHNSTQLEMVRLDYCHFTHKIFYVISTKYKPCSKPFILRIFLRSNLLYSLDCVCLSFSKFSLRRLRIATHYSFEPSHKLNPMYRIHSCTVHALCRRKKLIVIMSLK